MKSRSVVCCVVLRDKPRLSSIRFVDSLLSIWSFVSFIRTITTRYIALKMIDAYTPSRINSVLFHTVWAKNQTTKWEKKNKIKPKHHFGVLCVCACVFFTSSKDIKRYRRDDTVKRIGMNWINRRLFIKIEIDFSANTAHAKEIKNWYSHPFQLKLNRIEKEKKKKCALCVLTDNSSIALHYENSCKHFMNNKQRDLKKEESTTPKYN